MKSQPNAYDAAYAAAGLMDRLDDGASMEKMTRVALAACAIAEQEGGDLIHEGDYDSLLDRVGQCLKDRNWPMPGVPMEIAVRDVRLGMEGLL
jgi:hypothetical protein